MEMIIRCKHTLGSNIVIFPSIVRLQKFTQMTVERCSLFPTQRGISVHFATQPLTISVLCTCSSSSVNEPARMIHCQMLKSLGFWAITRHPSYDCESFNIVFNDLQQWFNTSITYRHNSFICMNLHSSKHPVLLDNTLEFVLPFS
jgi:hypothetical protein